MMRGEQLLRKYINSSLTREERFELEKIALDDDFLADAMDGFESVSKESARKALKRLTNKISGDHSTKIVPLYKKTWIYAVAASVALLAAITVFLPQNNQISENKEVAIVLDSEKTEALESEATSVESEEEDFISQEPNFAAKEIAAIQDEKIEASRYRSEVPLQSSNGEGQEEIAVSLRESQEVNEFDGVNLGDDKEDQDIALLTEESIDDVTVTAEKIIESSPSLAFNQSEVADTHAEIISTGDFDTIVLSDVAIEDKDFLDERSVNLGRQRKAKSSVDNEVYYNAAKSMQDTLRARPSIGFTQYREVLRKNNTVKKEDLFMHGISEGQILNVSFDLDNTGMPININIENLPDGRIKEAVIKQIESSGKWLNNSKKRILYHFPIRAK